MTVGMPSMFIIAYLYNNNGMATWCWEAAHALAEAGEQVLLVCARDVQLPDNCAVDVLRFDPPQPTRKTVPQKIGYELGRLSSRSSGFVGHLQKHLKGQGIAPTSYLLNSADLQDPCVAVPQYVVAWAYPTSFSGYIGKIGRYSSRRGVRERIRTLLSMLGWWRKDWRAYRSATGILAVSQRIANDLKAQQIPVNVVPPGSEVTHTTPVSGRTGPCRLLITALDLEEPRKRVRWMVDALKDLPYEDFHVTLVGHASEAFHKWVTADGFPATFTGFLSRDQVQGLMVGQDVFLFGSCLDDWGYVLVEAMSRGLAVVAPELSPFDEIVGNAGALYVLSSRTDFQRKVSDLVQGNVVLYRRAAWERAEQQFSRPAFARNLLSAVNRTGTESIAVCR